MIDISIYKFKQVYNIPENVPLSYNFHMVPDFIPEEIPEVGISGLNPLDTIHTSMYNMAKLLESRRNGTIDPDVLLKFVEWASSTYIGHYSLEESILKAFLPEDYTMHCAEHRKVPAMMEKCIEVLKSSPENAQEPVTDMYLGMVTDHFLTYDEMLVKTWKLSLTDKQKKRFLKKLRLL